jgi:outer membrane cobalamin receptor
MLKRIFMHKQRFSFYILLIQGFLFSVNAQQADTVKSTQQLPAVDVVGRTRTSDSKQSVPVQSVGKEDIVRLGMQDLTEAVRRFSGVTVKDYGGIGGLKTVSIRSLGAQHTAVSYDGVTISDLQSGQVDISRFTLDNVDYLSLSMGLDDDIFQTARTFASAGTLNIKTQKPVFAGKSCLLSAKLKAGSFGLVNPVLSIGSKLGSKWSATVQADYLTANGRYPFDLVNGSIVTKEKRENSDTGSSRLEANIYGTIGGKSVLETKLYTFNSEQGLPGSVRLYNKANSQRLWKDNSFVQLHYKNYITEKLILQSYLKYSYSFLKYLEINDNYASGRQEDHNTQHEYYGSAGMSYHPVENVLLTFSSDYAFNRLNNNFNDAPQPGRHTSLTNLAARYKTESVTASVSLLATYITESVKTGDKAGDRKKLSPSLAASWQPMEEHNLRFRASYKNIFRAPTFTDLYYLRVGNTDLRPENAKQFNVGVIWNKSRCSAFKNITFSADVFYNRVDDKIVALPTMYIWRMMNFGKVEIRGIDANVNAEVAVNGNVNMIVSGNYTYQHAVDATNPEAKNYKDQIPYTPRHTGNASVSFETPLLNFSYLLTAVGERYVLPQNIKANRVSPYIEQSITVNRQFTLWNSTFHVQGEILNPANARYDVIQYYPMPGRSWRLSLKWSL